MCHCALHFCLVLQGTSQIISRVGDWLNAAILALYCLRLWITLQGQSKGRRVVITVTTQLKLFLPFFETKAKQEENTQLTQVDLIAWQKHKMRCGITEIIFCYNHEHCVHMQKICTHFSSSPSTCFTSLCVIMIAVLNTNLCATLDNHILFSYLTRDCICLWLSYCLSGHSMKTLNC